MINFKPYLLSINQVSTKLCGSCLQLHLLTLNLGNTVKASGQLLLSSGQGMKLRSRSTLKVIILGGDSGWLACCLDRSIIS